MSLIQTSVNSRTICGFLVTLGKLWLGWAKRTRSAFKKRYFQRAASLDLANSVDYLSYSLDETSSSPLPRSADELDSSRRDELLSTGATRARSASDSARLPPSSSQSPTPSPPPVPAAVVSPPQQLGAPTISITPSSGTSSGNSSNTSSLKSEKRLSSDAHAVATVVEARKSRQVPLLQLLDLVNSLLKQFPTHFEFSETFVLFLVSQLCYGLPGQDAPPLPNTCSIFDLIDYVLANRLIFVNALYDTAASSSISAILSTGSAAEPSPKGCTVLLPQVDGALREAVNEHLAATLRMVPRTLARDLHATEQYCDHLRDENRRIRNLYSRLLTTAIDLRDILHDIEVGAAPELDPNQTEDGVLDQPAIQRTNTAPSRVSRTSVLSSVLGMRGLRRAGSSKDILVKPLSQSQNLNSTSSV